MQMNLNLHHMLIQLDPPSVYGKHTLLYSLEKAHLWKLEGDLLCVFLAKEFMEPRLQ